MEAERMPQEVLELMQASDQTAPTFSEAQSPAGALATIRHLDERRAKLIAQAFPPIPTLNGQGFVRLVDFMGSDARIVQAARVSYGAGTKTVREDAGLINYLIRNDHASPVEMPVVLVHQKMPIFIARQLFRHRTHSANEESARYSEVRDDFWAPYARDLRGQDKGKNKQAGTGEVSEPGGLAFEIRAANARSFQVYGNLLKAGVCREQARAVLPVSTMTQFYWQMNLRNWLHLCHLRADSHAQKEAQEYAEAYLSILETLYPATLAAWREHVQGAVKLSKSEAAALASWAERHDMMAYEGPELESALSKLGLV